jgi:hypothetical protein
VLSRLLSKPGAAFAGLQLGGAVPPVETGPSINVMIFPVKMYPVREATSHAASHEQALRSGERYLGDGVALWRGGQRAK